MNSLFLTQSVYRDLLDVMSRPGSVSRLPGGLRRFWPNGLLALAATLLDQEASYCVLDDPELAQALAALTGGKSEQLEAADFVFVPHGDSRGQIRRAKCGSQHYPDQGATVVYQVERLEADAGDETLVLRGPGIASEAKPLIVGLGSHELALVREINTAYPMGVDLLLVDRDDKVMALPRSLQIQCGKAR